MATEWFSFKKILQQRKVVVIDDNIHSREDAVVNALKVLDSFKLSFRYEFAIAFCICAMNEMLCFYVRFISKMHLVNLLSGR